MTPRLLAAAAVAGVACGPERPTAATSRAHASSTSDSLPSAATSVLEQTMCFSFLRLTACVIVEEESRVLLCLADRRWGSAEKGRRGDDEGTICDDDNDEVEGMEAATTTKALARRDAPLQLCRALDAVATAAGDVQLLCTLPTARI